jgi:hypothetical protein
MASLASSMEMRGTVATDAARELATEIQRALVPRFGDMFMARPADAYDERLFEVSTRLHKLDLVGVDTSVWLLPERECVWFRQMGAAEHLPNPLWAWMMAGLAGTGGDALSAAFNVLMRTGCKRADILNSCDGDGWSLVMTASRAQRPFRWLFPLLGIDWTYERPAPVGATQYSMLSEAIHAGDEFGCDVLENMTDAEISHAVRAQSAVMHRVVANPYAPRLEVLVALRQRTRVVWPDVFTADTQAGSLPTVVMHLPATSASNTLWDEFSSPLAPWHGAFMAACNQTFPNMAWQDADPLRAASTPCAPSLL